MARKSKPTKIFRYETYGLRHNYTTQTFDAKLARNWEASPYAELASGDSYSEVWIGTITWEKVDSCKLT